MNQMRQSVAAAVHRWARARTAPGKAAQPRPSATVTLRPHDDYTLQRERTETELDAFLYWLALAVLLDPFRTTAR